MDTLLACGVNKIAAHRLNISNNTVEVHVMRVLKKMKLTANKPLALVRWALWRYEDGTLPEGVKHG